MINFTINYLLYLLVCFVLRIQGGVPSEKQIIYQHKFLKVENLKSIEKYLNRTNSVIEMLWSHLAESRSKITQRLVSDKKVD